MTVARRRDRRAIRLGHVGAALALAALVPGCGLFDEAAMPPLDLAGSVGNTFSTRQFADEARDYTNQVNTLLSARTYVWQPWFVMVDGTLNAAYENEIGGEGDNDSTSLLTSGGLSLGILPLSNYATTLAYDRTDSRIESDFIGSDFTRDSFTIASRALIDDDLRSGITLNRDQIDQPAFGGETRNAAQLTVTKNFAEDSLTVGLDYAEEDFRSDSPTEDDLFDRTGIATIRYDSKPFENVYVQGTTILLTEDEEILADQRQRSSVQGISTAQWRPDDQPFTVNAAWRTLAETIEVDGTGNRFGDADSETRLASGTIGINYPIITGLTSNVGLFANYQDVTREAGGTLGELQTDTGSFGRMGVVGSVAYLSPPDELLGFTWRWNGTTATEFAYDTQEALRDSESVSVGHSGSRMVDLPWVGEVRLGLEQSVFTSHDTVDGFVLGFGHQLSLTKSESDERGSTFIRFAASDNRDVIGSDGNEFQLAQLQISRQSTIDLESDWHADLTLQIARQRFEEEETSTVFSANGTLGYIVRRLFGVERLQFTSDLILNSIGFESVIDVSRDDRDRGRPRSDFFRSDWRNRVDYLIGRLTASAEAVVLQENGKLGSVFLLRLRRSFGGGQSF